MRPLIVALFCLFLTGQASSQGMVTEGAHEPRVRELAAVLRCPVCQSENILDSQASTAREMLVILREQIQDGSTDEQIISFFRQRYGDYVLLRPATDGPGLYLWLLPLLFCAVFGLIGYRVIASLRRNPPLKGDALDESRLDEMEV